MRWRLGNSTRLRSPTGLQLWRTKVIVRTRSTLKRKTSVKEILGMYKLKQAKMQWVHDPNHSKVD
jgi:hypothetical protein